MFFKNYYTMDDHQLELEAAKFKIGGYSDGKGVIRERIIDQLQKKDTAKYSLFAIIISLISLVVSIIALGSSFSANADTQNSESPPASAIQIEQQTQ